MKILNKVKCWLRGKHDYQINKKFNEFGVGYRRRVCKTCGRSKDEVR